MSIPADQPLDPRDALYREYHLLEASFSVRYNADYESLVVANGNGSEGIHRWFRLKEAFSRRLLPRVIKDLGLDHRSELSLLDPFAGSGTSAISLGDVVRDGTFRHSRVFGFECNPFLQLVASSKLSAMQNPSRTFLPLAKKVAAKALRDRVEAPSVPNLAAFKNPNFFNDVDLRRLLQLREAIRLEEQAGANPLDVNLARMCLGGTVEPVSALRRDGRALRYEPSKDRAAPIREFLRRSEQVDDDMPARPIRIYGRILHGDGRILRPRKSALQNIDLTLFSPPYPNNIDYTEVYKLEAWLLGYIENQDSFINQRLRTVYSHPSVLRNSRDVADVTASGAVRALLGAVPSDRYETGRRAMIIGYLNDMANCLRSSYTALKPGGHLVYVVGNSLHGTEDSAFVIAADILLAELAVSFGFVVDRIDVARKLRRRRVESPYLRESVVFLRRPANVEASQ